MHVSSDAAALCKNGWCMMYGYINMCGAVGHSQRNEHSDGCSRMLQSYTGVVSEPAL